jgi:hypothetical protein
VLVRIGSDRFRSSFASLSEPWAAQLHPASLGARQSVSSARGDALLLGQGGEQMQDERVHVSAKLCDDELYTLCHQPADEVNITGALGLRAHIGGDPVLPNHDG